MLPVLRGTASLSPFGATSFNRLDSMFDHFLKDLGEPMSRTAGSFHRMPVSIWADENNLYVEAEVPGVSEKDVEVTVHGEVLTIKAVRAESSDRKYLYNGRLFGQFERAIVLPEAVETEQVEAQVVNGVLSMTLPKKAEARPRKISIKGA